MHQDVVSVVAAILLAGVIAQWLGWRLRVPAIVFLLAAGLIAGPLTGTLDPDATFGRLLFPVVSIAVAVILFEGALGLGARGIRAAGTTVWVLLSVGAVVTLVGTMIAARLILDVEWRFAALLASVLVVTGPTVIGPIIRSLGLHDRVGAILEAEGTLVDPIGAILTVVVFEAAFVPHGGSQPLVVEVISTLGVGLAFGLLGAGILVFSFGRFLIPDELHNITTLALVVGAFAAANAIRDESGLVAVTVMGVVLATQRRVPVRHVLEFNETLRILFISGLFVVLGARISPATLREFEWRTVAFLAALVLVVRPLCVAVSTIRSGLDRRERAFLACTAPRGIVAAAIASVFSLRLNEIGIANSQILVAATFTVIAGTVLLSGLGSRPLAIALELIDPDEDTVVVLGANPVARACASALEQHGSTVRLVDLDRRELSAARMTGLIAHRGSVFSEDLWEEASIQSASSFLAMTDNDELNTLAARHAAATLGRRQVFQIPPGRREHRNWWKLPVGTFARPLFARDTNFEALSARVEAGAKIVSTHLTDQFGPDQYAEEHADALVLFIVDADGEIELATGDQRRTARAGDTIVALTASASPD